MTIDFHDESNRLSYTTREAANSWTDSIGKMLAEKDIHRAVDIGCGGGIYAKALYELGIPNVTGIDFSEVMIEAAKTNCADYSPIDFKVGDAYDTGLIGHTYDLVLERALIHHLKDLSACFSEAFRVLRRDGTVLIQDRTPTDCLLEGSSSHIGGYFFNLFPHLKEMEWKRRYTSGKVIQELRAAGFMEVEEIKLWEVRQRYTSKKDFLIDLKMRTGRSILHELSDQELILLIGFIDNQLPVTDEIIEKDQWTIWIAHKCDN